jgi:acyl-CoA thioesterase-1
MYTRLNGAWRGGGKNQMRHLTEDTAWFEMLWMNLVERISEIWLKSWRRRNCNKMYLFIEEYKLMLISRRVLQGGMIAAAISLCMVTFANATDAKSIKVFAVGASNTNGKGVGADQAWPAVLERMLRAKGYDATVTVSAVNGDTSAGVLSRANSIPAGTQVVVFDTGADNDRLRGISEAAINANREQIIGVARAHGATAIQAVYRKVIGPQHSGGAGYQADEIHLTESSHAKMAAYLLPQVIAAAKRSH